MGNDQAFEILREDIKEIKSDVKILLEYKHKQEGKTTVISCIFGVFGGIIATYFCGFFK